MKNFHDTFLFGQVPFQYEIDNADEWTDPCASLKIYELIVAIKDAGFKGVDHTYTQINSKIILCVPQYDLGTPEGYLLAILINCVKNGIELPSKELCLKVIKQSYLARGKK